jgi:hyperosmotically inducible protein
LIVVPDVVDVVEEEPGLRPDAWITARVHERFVTEDLLKGSDINVDTDKHVVTLKGTVMASAGRTRAARIALRTEGVHRVVNRLTIGPKVED